LVQKEKLCSRGLLQNSADKVGNSSYKVYKNRRKRFPQPRRKEKEDGNLFHPLGMFEIVKIVKRSPT